MLGQRRSDGHDSSGRKDDQEDDRSSTAATSQTRTINSRASLKLSTRTINVDSASAVRSFCEANFQNRQILPR